MANLKEWVEANQSFLPAPPSDVVERIINRFNDYTALNQIKSNMAKRYESFTAISDLVFKWNKDLKSEIEDLYFKGYTPPKVLLDAYPSYVSIAVSFDKIKQLCDKHNWVVVSGNVYARSSSENKIYIGPPSIIDVGNIRANSKPIYIGSGLEPRLSPVMMYLPMVNSSSSTSDATSIHTSLYEDFKNYFGCSTTQAVFECEFKNSNALFSSKDLDNCKFEGFEVKSIAAPEEYMGKLIVPSDKGFTFEGSTKVYQSISAAKSGIRALVNKV